MKFVEEMTKLAEDAEKAAQEADQQGKIYAALLNRHIAERARAKLADWAREREAWEDDVCIGLNGALLNGDDND